MRKHKNQPDLFAARDGRTPFEKIAIPSEVAEQLARPDSTLCLSISGGKDSDAMCRELLKLRTARHWPCKVVAIHADLGAMEWHESGEHCQALCAALGIDYVTVRHSKHDLLAGIEVRMKARPDSPPFPSAAARYCTAGWKRDTISSWIRNNIVDGNGCVCAMGLRAQESSARAKKPVWTYRQKAHAPRKDRIVIDWHPILAFSAEDVWTSLGYSLDDLESWRNVARDLRAQASLSGRALTREITQAGFTGHPAYALGNERVSCAMCVLACKGDLANGAEARPDTYARLRAIECASGYSFQQNKPLAEAVAEGRQTHDAPPALQAMQAV